MAEMLAMVLVSTKIFVLTGMAAVWVYGVLAKEIANDVRRIRGLHLRLRRTEGGYADGD